jgi:glutamyl/glutaminyl-tRNA synthetase
MMKVTKFVSGHQKKALRPSPTVKSGGLAWFHLVALIDDHQMEITHVFRCSEWLTIFYYTE